MTVRIGISGFGRIAGTCVRIAQDMPDVEIAAINKRNANLDYMAYMLRYDSVFGRFPGEVATYDNGLVINGKKVPVFGATEISEIPWGDAGADYVIEATGAFLTTEKCLPHLEAGAKKVIISAPAKDDTPTFVYKVNTDKYTKDMNVVSNASCTTNCLSPICKVVFDNFGIEVAQMATIHASTGKQAVVDSRSDKDWRRGRSVYGNIVPTSTGASKAVGKIIPELLGKMTGISYRIPAADGSLVDIAVTTTKATTYEDICAAMEEASKTTLSGVLEYVDDEVTSIDFIGDPHTSIFDKRMGIQLDDHNFKLVGYYDNEYGYSAKTLELARLMHETDNR